MKNWVEIETSGKDGEDDEPEGEPLGRDDDEDLDQ